LATFELKDSMSGAYYNEHDPKAAAVLRELIKQGHIAPGEVDERSIEDVSPAELVRFTQCHFFAGYGVWSYALRRAGWPDDRAVWTGSCPCQPFSTAGKGAGFADERHLWPAFFHLISQRRPSIVFGEQVANKGADAWIDLVHTDLEALGYAVGAVPFPAASVGAPHGRDRIYWVGDPTCGGRRQSGLHIAGDIEARRKGKELELSDASQVCTLADAASVGRREECPDLGGIAEGNCTEGIAAGSVPGCGPVNGYWGSADWVLCGDPGGARWRPVEPGTFPLAHGAPERVGRLRGYGNAINAVQAQIFIEAVMEIIA
jgi:DNA (cytosine-5)-methyltransferase 1